jgi:basic amino acid/polyamine antiporter, APA family
MAAAAHKQTIGIWLTTGLVVGSMIGSGIFMLPVALAPLGPNAIAGWLVSVCGALAIAFALARLTRAGDAGIQSFIEQAFGPTVGFLVTWAFWCSCWSAQAAIAIAFGSAMSRVGAVLASPDMIVAVAVAATAFLAIVNAFGVRASGGLNLITVIIKIMPLVGVVVLLALAGMSGARFEPLAPTPLNVPNIATATTLTLFALTGFENVTTLIGKVRSPERTLPRAILIGVTLVGVVYLLSSTAVTFLLPADLVASSPAPYADIFGAYGGEPVVRAAALAIAISAFGALNCLVLAAGELGYAMAIRRQLPAAMTRVRAGNAPYVAQIVGAGFAILLVLANSSRSTAGLFSFIILLSTSAVLVVYLAGVLAAWRSSRSIGSRALILIALLFVAFAFYGSGAEADLWTLALMAVGLVVLIVMRRFNSSASTSPPVEASPAAPPGSSA